MRTHQVGYRRLPGLFAVLAAFILLIGLAPLGAVGATPRSGGTSAWLYAPLAMRSHPLPRPSPTPAGSCSTAPVLLSPAPGATLSTLIPLFEWDSGNNPNATMLELEVFRDPELIDRVYGMRSAGRARGRQSFRINANLAPATTYYWRTYLMCGDVQGPYAEVRSFTTGSGGEILPGPTLLAPDSGVTLPGVTVTLRWSQVTGAAAYQVHYTVGDWQHYGRVLPDTETTLTSPPLTAHTTYEWWVEARNDYAWGNESAHRQFTTGAGGSSSSAAPDAQGMWVEDTSGSIVRECETTR